MKKTFALLFIALSFATYAQEEILSQIKKDSLEQAVVIDKNNIKARDLSFIKRNLKDAEEITLYNGVTVIKGEGRTANAVENLKQRDQQIGAALLEANYRSVFSIQRPADVRQAEDARFLNSLTTSGNKFTVLKIAPGLLVNFALKTGFDSRHGFDAPASFVMPLKRDSTVVVEQIRVTEEDGRIIFTGKLSDNTGDVFLVKQGDEISGVIDAPTKHFSIRSLHNGDHVVIEKPQVRFEEEPARMRDKNKTNENRDARDGLGRVEPNENVEVKLLVLYTAAVEAANPNVVNNLIIPSIDRTNASLSISHLPNLKFSLAGTARVNYNESFVWEHHLDRLMTANDGVMDEVHALRNRVKADLVILIIHQGAYCGEAAAIGADEATSFAVVKDDCALDYFSFGHEIGHLFGCRHDVCVDPSEQPFSYGHGFVYNAAAPMWRCIMSYANCCSGCRRVGIWSNPELEYNGIRAGTLQRENNIEVLKQTAKRIAAIR